MKKTRNFFLFLIVLFASIGLVACGGNNSSNPNNQNPDINETPDEKDEIPDEKDETPDEKDETPDEKDDEVDPKKFVVKGINHVDLDNLKDEESYRFYVGLIDENSKTVVHDFILDLKIVVEEEVVFEKTFELNKSAFNDWNWTKDDIQYNEILASVLIPYKDITASKKTVGEIIYTVRFSNGLGLKDLKLDISDLPLDIEVTLPEAPFNINIRNVTIRITSIDYKIEPRNNDVKITIIFAGEKIYDSSGDYRSSSESFSVRIFDDEGYAVDNDYAFLPSIMVGDKFRNIEQTFYVPYGSDYTIEIIKTQY